MAEASWQDHTIFVGRFISTPAPNDLSIRHGAVLIDGQGVIEKVKWVSEGETNSMLAQALKSWGIESFDGRTVVLDDRNEEGFFFPGFIGMFYRIQFAFVVRSLVSRSAISNSSWRFG